MPARYIVHIDMDAFFAAVEQRDHPEFKGKPVMVGSDPKGGRGRGVVATCSYEARRFGIHSAMPISIAYNKCPQGVFLPVDMEKYLNVSEEIFTILNDFTPDVEPISVDEAFLDISQTHQLFGGALETCRQIKARIKKELNLTASIGLAPTKMAAKIASDLKKPDGLVEVQPEHMQEFLRPLNIRKISGLGEKTEIILNRIGITTIGQLADASPAKLTTLLGANGYQLHQLAQGINPREVQTRGEVKSISNETTFDQDTSERTVINRTLMRLSEKVAGRLRHHRLKARTITLKIRLTGFATYTRALTLDAPTSFDDAVYRAVKKLYSDFDCRGKKIRLLGVKASNFSAPAVQAELFNNAAKPVDARAEKLHQAIDKLKSKFGDDAICRGTSIKGRS
ncbi:MAG TPA: DNA polymerase IV [Planctomycetota bacterium]|nr:DNA polymerase IV [Planctomycetota bacterium]